MDLHQIVLFAAAVVGVSLIPGPSTLIAFAHGAGSGWLRSIWTALGNAAASILQAIAASAGLGVVLAGSASLFLVVKYLGAAYLIWAGIQMWRSAARRVDMAEVMGPATMSPARLFVSGFTVAASNPKAIIFFTALFPQFLSPEGTGLGQLATMVTVVGLGSFGVAAFYCGLGAWVRELKLSRRAMSRLHKATGGVFVASGLSLVAAR